MGAVLESSWSGQAFSPPTAICIYRITCSLTTLAVEFSTPDDFPLFIRGIAEDTGAETTMTIGASPFTFDSYDHIQLPAGNIGAITVTSTAGAEFALNTAFTIDRIAGVITRV